MKTTISDLVIAFLDLLEAEGRSLRGSHYGDQGNDCCGNLHASLQITR